MRRDIEMPADDEKSVMIENIESVPNLIGIGKQLLEDKDFSAAVEHFAMMCDELVPVHGDLGDILGEVYLHYGQSLLSLARNEIDVVGTLGKQFDEDDDNDSSSEDNEVDSTTNNEESKNVTSESKGNPTVDKKEESNAAKEAVNVEKTKKASSTEKTDEKDETVKSSDKTSGENSSATKVADEEKSSEDNKTDENKIDSTVDDTKQIENAQKSVEANVESSSEVNNGTSDNESKEKNEDKVNTTEVATNGTCSGPSTSTGIESEEKDEENIEDADKEGEISNLQLAWEILELAKKIFAERNETGNSLLIETLYHLGDVSFESENFDVAINDFLECIELQEKHNVKDRRLADAYFKTGLAYLNCEKYNESLKFFASAKNVLISYCDTFKPASDSEEDAERYKIEYFELQDIIKEINNKIQDVEECLNETRKSVREMLKDTPMPPNVKTNTESEASTSSETSKAKNNVSSSVSSVQANNITHLLRRKRPSDEPANEAVPSKKQIVTSNSKSPESK